MRKEFWVLGSGFLVQGSVFKVKARGNEHEREAGKIVETGFKPVYLWFVTECGMRKEFWVLG